MTFWTVIIVPPRSAIKNVIYPRKYVQKIEWIKLIVILCWFSSFLQGQYQSVVIGESLLSTPTVWGAVGFIALSIPIYIYRKPVDKLIQHHGVKYHHFPDDTQLYISAADKVRNSVDVISWCLGVIGVWIRHKILQWNPAKIEWLWVWDLPIWGLYHLSSWVELHTQNRPSAQFGGLLGGHPELMTPIWR